MKKVLFASILLGLLSIFLLLNRRPHPNKIAQPIPTQSTKNADGQSFTLISTGDIGLVRDVNYRILQKADANYPFLHIADFLKSADLTVTNLEGPLLKNCPIILTGFKFCGESTNVAGLRFAGIDAASIANNHTTNYGLEGLQETVAILDKEGVIPYGLESEIRYMHVKGHKIALVGFVELENNWAGLNNATPVNVSKLVSEAKRNSDIVLVSFHWGAEYTHIPTENQISLAHRAVDSGADLVLGNHPHWIQLNEIYRDKFITYAQGNTIFDQDWSQETKEGVLYKFIYKNGNFEKIEERYTIIEDNAQPRFATEQEVVKIKSKLPQKI